jgi:hypothetical protein
MQPYSAIGTKNIELGYAVQHFPGICEALGSTPSTVCIGERERKKERENNIKLFIFFLSHWIAELREPYLLPSYFS